MMANDEVDAAPVEVQPEVAMVTITKAEFDRLWQQVSNSKSGHTQCRKWSIIHKSHEDILTKMCRNLGDHVLELQGAEIGNYTVFKGIRHGLARPGEALSHMKRQMITKIMGPDWEILEARFQHEYPAFIPSAPGPRKLPLIRPRKCITEVLKSHIPEMDIQDPKHAF